jgi:hypothetical protein
LKNKQQNKNRSKKMILNSKFFLKVSV